MTKVYFRTTALSTDSALQGSGQSLSDGSVPASKVTEVTPKTLAERLKKAIEAEGTTQNKLGTRVGLSSGVISRYTSGQRGGTTVDVDKMRAIADVLHVRVEWLLWGDGGMRREGRDTTPAEEAMALARRAGIREEVWQSAWERYRDRAGTMTALDWAAAIHSEAQLWDRAAAQPPTTMATPVRPAGVDARPSVRAVPREPKR